MKYSRNNLFWPLQGSMDFQHNLGQPNNSHITHHTSYLTHNTSCITHHTSPDGYRDHTSPDGYRDHTSPDASYRDHTSPDGYRDHTSPDASYQDHALRNTIIHHRSHISRWLSGSQIIIHNPLLPSTRLLPRNICRCTHSF